MLGWRCRARFVEAAAELFASPLMVVVAVPAVLCFHLLGWPKTVRWSRRQSGAAGVHCRHHDRQCDGRRFHRLHRRPHLHTPRARACVLHHHIRKSWPNKILHAQTHPDLARRSDPLRAIGRAAAAASVAVAALARRVEHERGGAGEHRALTQRERRPAAREIRRERASRCRGRSWTTPPSAATRAGGGRRGGVSSIRWKRRDCSSSRVAGTTSTRSPATPTGLEAAGIEEREGGGGALESARLLQLASTASPSPAAASRWNAYVSGSDRPAKSLADAAAAAAGLSSRPPSPLPPPPPSPPPPSPLRRLPLRRLSWLHQPLDISLTRPSPSASRSANADGSVSRSRHMIAALTNAWYVTPWPPPAICAKSRSANRGVSLVGGDVRCHRRTRASRASSSPAQIRLSVSSDSCGADAAAASNASFFPTPEKGEERAAAPSAALLPRRRLLRQPVLERRRRRPVVGPFRSSLRTRSVAASETSAHAAPSSERGLAIRRRCSRAEPSGASKGGRAEQLVEHDPARPQVDFESYASGGGPSSWARGTPVPTRSCSASVPSYCLRGRSRWGSRRRAAPPSST